MKFLLDFFPLAVFVAVYSYSGVEKPIYPAVQALMIATFIQTVGSRLLTGKFEKTHVWTLVITLVAGGLTLLFRNPAFVIWKASIVVWVMAAVFLFRQFVQGKYLVQEMMSAVVEELEEVPNSTWKTINLAWPIANILFGFLNLYVAFNFSEAFWVKFKLFGLMGLTFTLIVFTMYKLFPYFPDEEEASKEENSKLANDIQNENEKTAD